MPAAFPDGTTLAGRFCMCPFLFRALRVYPSGDSAGTAVEGCDIGRSDLQAAGDLVVREVRRTRTERRRPRTGDRREPNDLRGGRGAVAASILPLRPPLPPNGAICRPISRSNGGIGKWRVTG